MSCLATEYEEDMKKAIKILQKWLNEFPELNEAIEVIYKTMWWK